MNLTELIIPLLFLGIISFVVAEFFGRAKHIGFWWTFFLSLGILPGVIAVILSPSADKQNTKGGVVHWVYFFIFLLVFMVNLGVKLDINSDDLSGYIIPFVELVTALYFYNLAKSNVINKNPKFYFKNNNSSNKTSNYSNSDINEYAYFIIENENQIGPFTFEELKNEKINENTYVWRKGLSDWCKAKDLAEIEKITVSTPPPFVNEVKPPPFVNEVKPPPINK